MIVRQAVGRGMRPSAGKKELLVLDHVGNIIRHGHPELPIEWSLEDKKPRKTSEEEMEEVSGRECPECFYYNPPRTVICESCGAELPRRVREIETVEGVLEEMKFERGELVIPDEVRADIRKKRRSREKTPIETLENNENEQRRAEQSRDKLEALVLWAEKWAYRPGYVAHQYAETVEDLQIIASEAGMSERWVEAIQEKMGLPLTGSFLFPFENPVSPGHSLIFLRGLSAPMERRAALRRSCFSDQYL